MSKPNFFAVRNAIAKRDAAALPTVSPLGAFEVRLESVKGTTVSVRDDRTIVVSGARIVATSYRVDKGALRTEQALIDGASVTIASDMFGGGRTTIEPGEFPISARLVATDAGYDAVVFRDPRQVLPLAA